MMNRRFSVIVVALMLIAFAGCGDDDTTSTTAAVTTMADDMDMGDDDHTDDAEHDDEFHFGEPAEASTADRVIEITAADDFSFSPDYVVVSAGETVTFRITNTGAIPHDFTLGDTEMQDEHEAEMAEMGGMAMDHDEPNLLTLDPGASAEMTWHLTEPGELIFGCHQIGHYPAGMLGTILVEG